MGDFEKQPAAIDTEKKAANRVPIIALLMTVLAFLAPVASAGYASGYGYDITISSVLWAIYMDGYSIRFYFHPPVNLMTMIPFLMFRVASVYQITRYYQGKTTKGRGRLAAFIGDAPFLIVYAFVFIVMGFYGGVGLNLPLPIMMIVGLLLLWKLPAYEATVPWEGASESKSWWEEKSEDKTEPPTDNQPW